MNSLPNLTDAELQLLLTVLGYSASAAVKDLAEKIKTLTVDI
jgi:hypothetical protein